MAWEWVAPAVTGAATAIVGVSGILATYKAGARQHLQSHFGTYLVCVEKQGPFDVAAFDSDGKLLSVLPYPHPMYRRHRRHSATT
jgi:hypothetical protein